MNDIKRVLVFSDSHGNLNDMKTAILREKESGIAEIWHLGDYSSDAKKLKGWLKENGIDATVSYVRGNCDAGIEDAGNLSEVKTVCGRKAFLTHGHIYNVGYSLMRLSLTAEEAEAEIALYGHTHIPNIDFAGRMIILNPGSISEPRGGSRCNYAVLRFSNDGIYPELKSI